MFTSAGKFQGIKKGLNLLPEPSVEGSLVSLLSYMNGSDGGTTFTDFKGHVLTRNGGGGGPVTSTAQSKFAGSSGLFVSASGQYLSTPNGAEFAFGTGDFLVEGWFYLNSVGSTQTLAGTMHGSDGDVTWALQVTSAGKLRFQSWTIAFVTGNTTLVAGRWYHLAASRVGSNVYAFVDGIQDGVLAAGGMNLSGAAGAGLWIGHADGLFNGYMTNLRIVKGQGISASFSVPTDSYPNPNSDPYINDVTLLMHMDGVNGGTSFPDVKGHIVTPTLVTTSSTIPKFGSAAAAFGAGSSLSVPSSTDFDMAGDFTIECWMYVDPTMPDSARLFSRGAFNQTNNLSIEIDVNNRRLGLRMNDTGGAPGLYTSSLAYSFSTWHHVAVSRTGTTVQVFVDGVSKGTTTNGNVANAATPFLIGALNGTPNFEFKGYIDEFRVTKGVGRYTTTFTPVGPFPEA